MELPRTDHVGKHFGGASLVVVTLRRGSGISAGTDVRLNCEGYDSDRGSATGAVQRSDIYHARVRNCAQHRFPAAPLIAGWPLPLALAYQWEISRIKGRVHGDGASSFIVVCSRY